MRTALQWFDRTVLDLGRQMRVSYLPPLMVYLAAGVSGLTGIVGTFFVKDYLGLSAEFLAALGFWVGLPWALKVPIGHLVDLIWRWKALLVWLGAALLTASLLIMLGLLTQHAAMARVLSIEHWYVLANVLSPIGYVLQDCVADAMTVEAVPVADTDGTPIDEATRKVGHTTVQMLGRVAIIGGSVLVSAINVLVFRDVGAMSESDKLVAYEHVYLWALIIPAISVAGVLLAAWLQRHQAPHPIEPVQANVWILGGGFAFAVFSIAMGLSDHPYNQEIIFVGSMAIVLFLMRRLMLVLEDDAARSIVATALMVFVFRALPGPGAGVNWWTIDALGFDQQFLATLSLISSGLTLIGMFVFRRFMAEHSMARIIVILTLIGTFLSLPTLSMFHGLHHWTAAHTGGVVDARFIALIDVALESPLGQVAMIPMLAWIAASAPAHLKATYFAVMASFTNLALSAAQLGTKYLNQIYHVSREVKDRSSGVITQSADYSQLGDLLLASILIGLALPLCCVLLLRLLRLRTA